MITSCLSVLVAVTYDQDPLTRYLILSALLFSIGVYGMTTSRNAVRVLMSIELMLNAVNINLVAFARYVDPDMVRGQLFAIFILTVAAAEAAVGLAIVLSIYRNSATVDMEKFNLLKW
ncbi:MAG: NADH-quinone oxidoreductase subunit NuoK [Candidatus Obscuribacterales bacterium]|nr:NADH-quinone oxidoreductase subunit NuoK [Candidatus Obscuribacterales bacterium]